MAGNAIGHGIDVVEIAEFSRLIDGPAKDHLNRYFNDHELSSAGAAEGRVERLASRFAIKEAVLKALGTGWGDGVSFTDVEVLTQASGAPSVLLHRDLAATASRLGIRSWLVSASHTGKIVFASAIALS